jgi:hypothetical protein
MEASAKHQVGFDFLVVCSDSKPVFLHVGKLYLNAITDVFRLCGISDSRGLEALGSHATKGYSKSLMAGSRRFTLVLYTRVQVARMAS